MRNFIDVSINGVRHKIQGADSFSTLSDFLRYKEGATGTKVVCAEGDCGACTVISKTLIKKEAGFEAINSCIAFMWQLDGNEIITVEGLKLKDKLHPAQEAMMTCHGAQCGYCTPGFICSMAQLAQDAKTEKVTIDRKKAQNYLTGNLCRCTGYEAILEAAEKMDLKALKNLDEFYDKSFETSYKPTTAAIECARLKAYLPSTLEEAKVFMREIPKVVSGATDLGVLHNKGKWQPQVMMSLKNIPELYEITHTNTEILIGARASLADCSNALEKDFPEFSRLMRIFASPQIKNSATLVGNMMNASPIADSIPFLNVANANIHLLSPKGPRIVGINEFFKPGYKQMDLAPQELVTHISLPKENLEFKLYKVSKRKDLDISAVTLAIAFKRQDKTLTECRIALGGVAVSVLRLTNIEGMLINTPLTETLMVDLFNLIDPLITPQSDVRGSSDYRRLLVRNLLLKFFHEEVSV